MKTGFLRPQLLLLLFLLLCFSVSVTYGEQFFPRNVGTDGRSNGRGTQSNNSQAFVLYNQSANIKQDPGASGGGEGKPDDWGSPQIIRVFWNASPTYQLLSAVSEGSFVVILHLISWWE